MWLGNASFEAMAIFILACNAIHGEFHDVCVAPVHATHHKAPEA
jgi:hypothetical protein